MTRSAIYQELKGMRRWVLPMGILALLMLSAWCFALHMAWAKNLLSSDQFIPKVNFFIQALFMQFCGIVLAALLLFVYLVRLGLSLGRLQEGDEVALLHTLKLNQIFWRLAEVIIWAVAWVTLFLVAGVVSLIFVA